MPFLGVAFVAWITLMVGVMAYYFLFVARHNGPTGSGLAPETYRRPLPEPTPARPWIEAAPSVHPRSDFRPNQPTYDMEDFPTEMWTLPPTAG